MESPLQNPWEVDITAVAFGGKGIARCHDKVYFVDGAVEGDRVLIKPTSESKRYGEAVIEQMITPSPFRSPPLCPVAEPCGGCQWMGVDYEKQSTWKKGFVTSALQRIGKIADHIPIHLHPSPQIYHYRNRVMIRVRIDDDGNADVGYFGKGSKNLVPIPGCEIAVSSINTAINQLRELKFPRSCAHTFKIEIQELPFDNNQVVLTVYPDKEARIAPDKIIHVLKEMNYVFWVGPVWETREAPLFLYDEQFGVKFYSRPGQFQQVNRPHNHTLRALVNKHAESVKPSRVLDLFCGSGNLSLQLADGTRYIEGIEFNPEAILIAKENVRQNQITNTCYLSGATDKHMWKCYRKGESFDLIITDPPRQGMYDALIPLKNLKAPHIIYVSCDPATLARDISSLCRNDLYEIEQIDALDFFPNTYHIETVVKLKIR